MLGRVSVMGIFFTSLAFGMNGQSTFFHYNYTQKDNSEVLLVTNEDNSERMSRGVDMRGNPVTGQGDFYDYSYTQKDYSNVLLVDIRESYNDKMSRGIFTEELTYYNGQASYYDYLYTQGDYSEVLIKDKKLKTTDNVVSNEFQIKEVANLE